MFLSNNHLSSFPRSAWERTPGRSASRPETTQSVWPCVPTQSVGTRKYYLVSALLIWLFLPTDLWAHGLRMTSQMRGGQLKVKVFFDPDVPVDQAKVRLIDEKDQVIASGQTDSNGSWSCSAPQPGKYHLKVNAGAGHRKSFPITITDQDDLTSPADEYTSFPLWLKALLGLGIIAVSCLVVLWFRRRLRKDEG